MSYIGKWIFYTPIELENAKTHKITKWKSWRDFPHKKGEWVLSDDNWLVHVTDIFPNGAVSLCRRWVITEKNAKKDGYAFRVFKWYRGEKRFNNRLQIFVNTGLLTGDWLLARKVAFLQESKKPHVDIVYQLNGKGEAFLLQQLDKLLDEIGVSDRYLVQTLKNFVEGISIDIDGNPIKDKALDGKVRLDALKMLFKIRNIEIADRIQKVPMINYNDNRRITLNPENELKKLDMHTEPMEDVDEAKVGISDEEVGLDDAG